MGDMIGRVFFAALLAGLIAGVFHTGIQKIAVVPMILEAETYEASGPDHGPGGEEAWAPTDGMERTFYSALANVLTAVGFALLLTAAYALRGGIDWRRGALWGLAGFAAFNLAPALGLPPELPGAAAAPLAERQIWWLLTALSTAGGLAVIAFAPRHLTKSFGVVLIAVPHIVGAPQPEEHGGLAPADLEQAYIYASLITNAAFWIVLGVLTGHFHDRFGRKAGTSESAAAC